MPGVLSAETLGAAASLSSVAEFLRLQSQRNPDQEALVFESERMTYRQLERRAVAIAAQLADLGIGRGDRVGLLFPNRPEFVACFFAISGLGATVVPINPLLRSEEIAHILRDSQARAVVSHQLVAAEVLRALPEVEAIEHVVVALEGGGGVPEGPAGSAARIRRLTEAYGEAVTADWVRRVERDRDLAVLVYTSGTTGKPKGAMLTHQNLFSTVLSALEAFEVGPSDRFLAALPLCHIYGMAVVMLGTISRGGSIAVVDRFDARQTLNFIERHRVTLVPAVPAMYQFMLMELERSPADLSSVRMCLSGAAALPVELISHIERAFGAPLVEGYGMTETSCVATCNPLRGVRKPGSVGLPIPGVEIGIVGEGGALLPYGREHVGEIAVRGPGVMQGYYRQPQATAAVFDGGWFLTGDLGYKDEDGYLYIVGRKKELIIRGGQNIYPREIEEVIARMPQVAEVAVVGVPDKFMGERVKAVVVARPGASLSGDEVKEFCAARLAEYKVPRLVEFSAALPRNSTGKVMKRLLVERVADIPS